MQIHFLDRGTKLNISVQTLTGDELANFQALYHDSKGHLQLTVEGNPLYDYFTEPRPDTKLFISFYREQHKYSFDGRFGCTEEKYGQKLTNITMLSNIVMENRRAQKRFEIRMKVNIYAYSPEDNQRGILLGEGETNDICFDAFSISSNIDMPISGEARFAMEFTLFTRHQFFLPFRVLKKWDAPVVTKMDYDYVLPFEFANHQHEKNRLINTFFKELAR
jgi:hypothetical protein